MTRHEEQLAAFGQRLRELRQQAGLTTYSVADRTELSQSKISRLETGKLLPTSGDVESIAAALDLPYQIRDELSDEVQQLRTEVTSWRRHARKGLSTKQKAVREQERETTLLRGFQPVLVPGLLQLPEYARSVFTASWWSSPVDVGKAVANRIERQAILYEHDRQFEFILTEAALRHTLCSPAVMQAQVGHLITMTRMGNVRLGVIPFDRLLPANPMHPFWLYDARMVSFETFSGETLLRDERDVRLYTQIFAQFGSVALWGDDARAMLDGLTDEYRHLASGANST